MLPEPNPQSGHTSSYRSVYFIDAVGKVLEMVVYITLVPIIEYRDALSQRQFGFRQAHSMIDVIDMALKLAPAAVSSY